MFNYLRFQPLVHRKQELFNNLHLKLEAGQIHGLLGKNGAGKTTLLRLICGLTKPQKGRINIFGMNPQRRMPSFLSDCIYLSEDLFLPSMSIKAYAKLYGIYYPKFDETRFGELLEAFELNLDAQLEEISFGQQKMALIAFVLATNARLILMDEPTNGLDIPSKKKFRKFIAQSITPERGFLISTHQIRDLQSLIDTVIVLDKGDITFSESTSTITEVLSFKIVPSVESKTDVIYHERTPGGYSCISPDLSEGSLELDIELLFNAILAKGDRINTLISRPKQQISID